MRRPTAPSAAPTLIIPPAGAARLAGLSSADVLDRALFHGSDRAVIQGPLRGGMDGLLWTVQHAPAIAQTYIPRTGGAAYWRQPRSAYDAEQRIRPDGAVEQTLAGQIGWDCTVHRTDATGRAMSWSWRHRDDLATGPQRPSPTAGDLEAHVRDTLGYAPRDNGMYELRTIMAEGRSEIVPAAYRRPAALVTLLPQAPLRLYDLARDAEGDLTDPDHQRYDLFRRLAEDGQWDGVQINDFAQSPSEGNWGHRAIGLLPSGLAKVSMEVMPAVHVDAAAHWPRRDTDDFQAGYAAAVRAAQTQRAAMAPPPTVSLASTPRAMRHR